MIPPPSLVGLENGIIYGCVKILKWKKKRPKIRLGSHRCLIKKINKNEYF